jgi:16S rRNA (adenine1518-N6/adenine1519-N6)-dimethyltransferase
VSIQYFAKPKIIARVSASSFHPKPNVDSAIIAITPHDTTSNPHFTKPFFQVARAGFAEKRKQLLNNLSHGLHISKEDMSKYLSDLGIDPRRRAETLTIEEWRNITTTLAPLL